MQSQVRSCDSCRCWLKFLPFLCDIWYEYDHYHVDQMRMTFPRILLTCTATPPTATAVEAGDWSHCRGLDWGFRPRLRVQPIHRLSNVYSIETWDTISQTAQGSKGRGKRRIQNISHFLCSQSKPVTVLRDETRNMMTYTLPGCQSVELQLHLWSTCRTQDERTGIY